MVDDGGGLELDPGDPRIRVLHRAAAGRTGRGPQHRRGCGPGPVADLPRRRRPLHPRRLELAAAGLARAPVARVLDPLVRSRPPGGRRRPAPGPVAGGRRGRPDPGLDHPAPGRHGRGRRGHGDLRRALPGGRGRGVVAADGRAGRGGHHRRAGLRDPPPRRGAGQPDRRRLPDGAQPACCSTSGPPTSPAIAGPGPSGWARMGAMAASRAGSRRWPVVATAGRGGPARTSRPSGVWWPAGAPTRAEGNRGRAGRIGGMIRTGAGAGVGSATVPSPVWRTSVPCARWFIPGEMTSPTIST